MEEKLTIWHHCLDSDGEMMVMSSAGGCKILKFRDAAICLEMLTFFLMYYTFAICIYIYDTTFTGPLLLIFE